jgi:DNA-binding NtrC family response regulator
MEAISDVVHEPNHALEDEALAARNAATTILITAECAAAVERLARRIHAASDRAASPFEHVAAATLPIDAAALTETCAALLATARGGSLLLTDVEHMPALVQNRLIETFAGLQAACVPACPVRLIAGTTTILYEGISDGTFSEQLFYRLNIIHVVGKTVLGASAPAGGVG